MDLGGFLFIFISCLLTSWSFFGTIAASFIKELGNNGYVLDDKSFDSIYSIITDDDSDFLNKLLMIVPIINVFYSLYICNKYVNNKNDIFISISNYDDIRRMTEEELKKYEENKSIFTLLDFAPDNTKNEVSYDTNNSFTDSVCLRTFECILNKNGFIENEKYKDMYYYAISDFTMKTGACIAIKEIDDDGCRKATKVIAKMIADQLSDNSYLEIDLGFLLLNALEHKDDKKNNELRKHLTHLYAAYDFFGRKNYDISDDLVELTKKGFVFASIMTSNKNLSSFILDYDLFIEELNKYGLTVIGIDNLSYKDLICHLMNKRLSSLKFAVGRIKLNDDKNDNEAKDKPKEFVKTPKEKN